MNAGQILKRFPEKPHEAGMLRLALVQIFYAFRQAEIEATLVGAWMGTVYHDGPGVDDAPLEALKQELMDAEAVLRRSAEWLHAAAVDLDVLLLDREANKRLSAHRAG